MKVLWRVHIFCFSSEKNFKNFKSYTRLLIRNWKSASGSQNFQDHYFINFDLFLANGSLGKILTCCHDIPYQPFTLQISMSQGRVMPYSFFPLPTQLRSHQRLFLPFHQNCKDSIWWPKQKNERIPEQGLSHSHVLIPPTGSLFQCQMQVWVLFTAGQTQCNVSFQPEIQPPLVDYHHYVLLVALRRLGY